MKRSSTPVAASTQRPAEPSRRPPGLDRHGDDGQVRIDERDLGGRIVGGEAKRCFAPTLYTYIHQATRTFADRQKGAEDFEVLHEDFRIVRDYIAPKKIERLGFDEPAPLESHAIKSSKPEA